MTCEQKIIIPGPCSAETLRQINEAARMVVLETQDILKDQVDIFVRSPMTKEPTFPSDWLGPGEKGFKWLVKICNEFKVKPATEITSPNEAKTVARISNNLGIHGLFIWFGSLHFKGKDIRKSIQILRDIPNLKIGIKNPPNDNLRNWQGRIDWAMEGGANINNLLLIARGHDPQKLENPFELRNLPNHEETISLGQERKLKIILDPSHMGGTPEKVLKVLQNAPNTKFDGWMIETCPTPTKTDEKQRLDLQNFRKALGIIAQSLQHD